MISINHYFRYGLPLSPVTIHAYTSYALQYDRTRRVPVWVGERLRSGREGVRGDVSREKCTFKVYFNY